MRGKLWRSAWFSLWVLALALAFLSHSVETQGRPLNTAWSNAKTLFPLGQNVGDRSLHIELAFSQRTFLVIWSEQGGAQATDTEIILARSENQGKAFSNFVFLSNSPGVASDFPSMWVGRDNVYVAWEEGTGQDKEIKFSKSSDRGKTFTTPINISKTANKEDRDAHVVANGNVVLVVWEQVVSGTDSDIFFSFSRDGGKTFDPTVRNLSLTGATLSTFPQAAIGSSGEFFVAWEDTPTGGTNTDIFFQTVNISPGGGVITGTRINISNSADKHSLNPTLATPGSSSVTSAASGSSSRQVFLLWEEGGTATNRTDRDKRLLDDSTVQEREIFLARSDDEGKSFPVKKNLSNTPKFDSRRPAFLALGSKTLFLAWEEEEGDLDETNTTVKETTTGKTDIWFTKSEDSGNTFFPLQNLSHSFGVNSRHVRMASDGQQRTFLVWDEEVLTSGGGGGGGTTTSSEILFSRSTDGGEDFFTAQNLSNSLATTSRLPMVTNDGKTVLVFWEENPLTGTGTAGERQLFVTRNLDGGIPFSSRIGALSIDTEFYPSPVTETPPQEEPVAPLEVRNVMTDEAWHILVRAPKLTERLQLEVYDLAGRLIFAQEAAVPSSTAQVFVWSMTDQGGRRAATGIYLYRVTALGSDGQLLQSKLKKLIVLR